MMVHSGLGVIIPAATKIITIAYRRVLRINLAVKIFRLANIYINIGSSNTIPLPRVSVVTVVKYELILKVFLISSLALKPAKNLTDIGVIIK